MDLSGLVVRKDFVDRIMAVEDLPLHTPLTSTTVSHTMKVPFRQPYEIMKAFLQKVYQLRDLTAAEEEEIEYDTVEKADEQKDNVEQDRRGLKILDTVNLQYRVYGGGHKDHIFLDWDANPISDVIADSLISFLLTIDSSPGMAKRTILCESFTNLFSG